MSALTGDAGILEAVKEGEDCDKQMKTERVCRDPRQMQVLDERLKVICNYLEGALTGVQALFSCPLTARWLSLHEQGV